MDRPGLELLSFDVEAHKHVPLSVRFAIPDYATDGCASLTPVSSVTVHGALIHTSQGCYVK